MAGHASSGARTRRFKRTPLRLFLVAAGLLTAFAALGYAFASRWTPSRALYPSQGIGISAASGEIDWPTVVRRGADFAYVGATEGGDGEDPRLAANLAGARRAGLRYGAEHRFSLCAGADAQAQRFIASVPRDAAMLPPVVRLAYVPECPARPSRDKLLSELNTFLNQIETHGGKPAILRVARAFDKDYDIGTGINRTLWLEGDFLSPTYATRPWVMWTASSWKRIDGVPGPMEWDVVRP